MTPRTIPAPNVTEAEFQQTFLAAAHVYGWRTMHVRKAIGKRQGGRGWQTPTSLAGWPDCVLWSERQQRVLFVELKSGNGKATAEQEQVLRSLSAAGAEVRLYRPDDWERIVDDLKGVSGG